MVLAIIGSANRDPAAFPDPTRLDIARDPNYNQALNTRSAENGSAYHVYEGVKKKGKEVFRTNLKIKSVVYSNNAVTINLKKPYKGLIEVAGAGAIESQSGNFTTVEYTATVK